MTQKESVNVSELDMSDKRAGDTIASGDDAVPEDEDSEDAEFKEDESETIKEEDLIEETVTTVADFEQEVSDEGMEVYTIEMEHNKVDLHSINYRHILNYGTYNHN